MTELADQQFENAYRVLVEDVEPFEAVADARLHHQLIPNQVVTENYTSPFSAENVVIQSPEYVITGELSLFRFFFLKKKGKYRYRHCHIRMG